MAIEGTSMIGPEFIVRVEDLSYQYPRSASPVLRDINLHIRKGEFLGIVGPTGAGKTTLCLALNGIVPQIHGGRFFGRVTLAGLDTVETPIHRLAQHVAMVFQDPETQLVTNSVEDEVAFPLENLSIPREEIMRRIPWALRAVRLDGKQAKHPSELSGGEKQRLAIAAALAMQPEVLVLDEPTSQLDPQGSHEVFATVHELNSRLGITVVLASHASEELAEHADRLVLLARGELVATDTPARLFSQAQWMEQNALRPPQVVTFFQVLGKRGVRVPTVPVTLAEAIHTYAALRPAIEVRPPLSPPGSEKTLPDGVGSFEGGVSSRERPVALSLQDVAYAYPDGTRALQGVSLSVQRGEYAIIIGQNGAGKTTLVKQCLHLLEPAAGTVMLNGQDVCRLQVSEIAQRVGFVSQNPDNQIFTSSVEAEVAFALRHLGIPKGESQARVEESLLLMGLTLWRKSHPLSLSKGDRARVVTAAVLAMRPDILIFDEPTTGQDYAGARRILGVSQALHRSGKTVLVVTHHLHLMPGYAERAVIMGKGLILLDAPLRVAYHADEVLRSTHLLAPQIIRLAQHMQAIEQMQLPIMTPEELAACIRPRPQSPRHPPPGAAAPPVATGGRP